MRPFIPAFLIAFFPFGTVHAELQAEPQQAPASAHTTETESGFTQRVRDVLASGALDDVLEKRWDLIQQRKHALRLSQLREKKAKAARERKAAIKKYIPAQDTDNEPFLGAKNGAFSLIVYSDFGCPYCKKFHRTAKAFIDKYGKHANLIYRSMPLSIHEPYATELAMGWYCIYRLSGNNTYWNYVDTVYTSTNLKNGKKFVDEFAGRLGISSENLTSCMTSRDALSFVEKQIKDANKGQFTGTPSVILRNNLTGEFDFFAGATSLRTLEESVRKMAEKTAKEVKGAADSSSSAPGLSDPAENAKRQ
ncbi:DsbA family protein [Thiolapillus sp.]|uniref:DsbA family protein n=2 Tax=Thiolapillus sp. TaxID=2017437 RepID=UPI0025DA3FFD|nr:thioredoxin domain-containing protein [Thiolapillus sp.]